MDQLEPDAAWRREQEFDGGLDELFAEIHRLTAEARVTRDLDAVRRLLRLRHIAGITLTETASADLEYPAPAFDAMPEVEGLPSFEAGQVSAELMRAAILRDGCMIVRGYIDPSAAEAFAHEIDRAFAERERAIAGEAPEPGYYEPFRCNDPYQAPPRRWIRSAGGLIAVDSPLLAFELMEMYEGAAIPRVVADYLGAAAVISVQKSNFRKTEPTTPGAWHQDGAFMGRVRSLNLWVSLSHCGEAAPGLDIVPRRLDELAPTGTEGAFLPDQVSHTVAEQVAGELGIVRPTFAPGDVVFFDDLCLHRTAVEPTMTEPRYAIESWFFAGPVFPAEYAPVAVTPPIGA